MSTVHKYKITFDDGTVEEYLSSDNFTPDDVANSRFGASLADLNDNGVKIEALGVEEPEAEVVVIEPVAPPAPPAPSDTVSTPEPPAPSDTISTPEPPAGESHA